LHIVISTIGTAGDIYPCIALGRALARRGHEVDFHGGAYFQEAVERAGLAFTATMSTAAYLEAAADPAMWDPKRSMPAFWQRMKPVIPVAYERIMEAVRPGETVLVGSTMAFWVRLAQEKTGAPTATIHPAPYAILSAEAPPAWGLIPWLGRLPAWAVRGVLSAAEMLLLDSVMRPDLNAFRATIGLPPVRRIASRWLHSPDLVICAVPEWFTPAPRDWPPNTVRTGFPRFEEAAGARLDPALAAFIEAGTPPVAATPSSGMAHGRAFFARTIEACAALGRRAVLVTSFRDQLPEVLPDFVFHARYVPYALLLPRLAAIIHAGGIGTTAHAFATGTPQLFTPFNHDHFDNAAKAVRLGGGLALSPDAPAAKWIAALSALLEPGRFAPACASLARRMAADPSGTERMADYVERLRPAGVAAAA
jgi:rhamnosyltransferase subunit B